jgi:hypothetical protein
MADLQQEMSQEALGEWVRSQFQKANKHLAENGILFESVVTQDSRYLAPMVAVWKIKAQDGRYFWVISGDMPVDFVPADVASDVRGVLKHFSLLWNLKVENLSQAQDMDATQQQYLTLLGTRAADLYLMSEDDKLWQG